LCLGDIIGDWNAAQAFGMVSASVMTVIAVTYSGILFLQYIIARGIVWSSAGSDSGEGMPVGGRWNAAPDTTYDEPSRRRQDPPRMAKDFWES